jgi:hypothetical protein
MKNLHNLITDAFVRIGKDETKYSITIEYTEFTLRSYGIVINSLDPGISGSSSIVLLLNSSNKLIDYYEMNNLFADESWSRFCDVFEWEI